MSNTDCAMVISDSNSPTKPSTYSFPTLKIPQVFVDQYLWDPNGDNNASDSVQGHASPDAADSSELKLPASEPSFRYNHSPSLIADTEVAVSYAFLQASKLHRATQSKPGPKPSDFPPEMGVTLYSPYHGGSAVLDSMVRILAEKHNADVLVLDSLELAAGKFSLLGEDCHRVINMLYKSKTEYTPEPDETDALNAVQSLFKTLIQVKPVSSGPGTDSSLPLRRIIYLRDYGSISRGARPIMCAILQAIFDISTADSHEEAAPPALIVILGVSRNLGKQGTPSDINVEDCFNVFSWTYKASVVEDEFHDNQLAQRGTTLQSILPTTAASRAHPHGSDSWVHVDPLLSVLLVPILPTNTSVSYRSVNPFVTIDDDWIGPVDRLISNGLCLSCYPENTHTHGFRVAQQNEIIKRTVAINNLLLKVSIVKKGGSTVDESLLDIAAAYENDDRPQTDGFLSLVMKIASAESIATTAVGLAYTANPLCGFPVPVSPSHVAKAYDSFCTHNAERVNWLKAQKNAKENPPKVGEDGSDGSGNESDDDELVAEEDPVVKNVKAASDLTEYEEQLVPCIIQSQNLTTSFDDVCLDPKVIEVLRMMVMLPIRHPQYFKTGILAKEALSGALLYGPPGTGKTMVCRALARECGARMLLIKPSDVFDKYVGESEKLAKSIFTLAYRLAPCVIFIDEVEALFGSRDSSGSSSYRKDVLIEFLQAMDGLHSASMNKDKGIVVIGATNRPFDIDLAILRRLPCRMFVDLPGEEERQRILKSHLKDEALHDEVDLAGIASTASGYSGSDLKNLCVAAAMASVKATIGPIDWSFVPKKCPQAAAGSKASKKKKPAAPSEDVDMPATVEPVTVQPKSPTPTRTLTMAHFEHAFTEVTPSFSKEGNWQLYEWHAEHEK